MQFLTILDNVGLHIDGVLYVKVDDPYKTSYGVEDPEYAVTQLAQTTMRSEIGKLMVFFAFSYFSIGLFWIESFNHWCGVKNTFFVLIFLYIERMIINIYCFIRKVNSRWYLS